MKNWYVNKDLKLEECDLVKNTPKSREIQLKNGKLLKVHPENVNWSKIYPRLYQTDQTEPKIFHVYKRTMLIKNIEHADKIPSVNPTYRFQPFIADVIDSIHQNENVILTGGTGVGKTTHIVQLAARINQPMLRINFNGETRMSDLIGKISVLNGATVWTDGVLPMAMRNGYWLLLDEIDFADPAVLSLLHPVLEEESQLVLKENSGEIVKPHPNFRLFATANSIGSMQDRASSYSGTNTMNDAFLDRWQIITVDNLPEAEEIKVIKNNVPAIRHIWAKRIVDFANKVRKKDDTIEFSGDNFSTRKVLSWAKKSSLHQCPLKGAKLSWLHKLPESEHEPIERSLKVLFGYKK